MSDCTLQYFYKSEELRSKYKINCTDKVFENFNNLDYFNNKDFLQFIIDRYGPDAFNGGESPFTFKDNYIDQTNKELCNPEEYSLKPQQKFVGQYINPATNFNSSLVFHGLGSGKTCTSIVVGEAFKTTAAKDRVNLLYVVPAPLVEQYYEEIIGELKRINKVNPETGEDEEINEIWSCTSQCVIRTDNDEGDIYTNVNDKTILDFLQKTYTDKRDSLQRLSETIQSLRKKGEDFTTERRQFIDLQNQLNVDEQKYKRFRDNLISRISKVFEITSHDKFINKLFKINADGSWTKNDYLTKSNSPLLIKNGLLVIDEIQRMVSESGVLYQKLKTALYQYCHPELRTIFLSATPIYDNPYEMALTLNLLRPRVPFPITKNDFYSFFLGKYLPESDRCIRSRNPYVSEDSCLINKDLLRYLCSGYVSYFRGGNPNAYPYKRIITLEHIMPAFQKEGYLSALYSDAKRDRIQQDDDLEPSQFIIKSIQPDSESTKEDAVNGVYVTTQQFANISLPFKASEVAEGTTSKKSAAQIKSGLKEFEKELKAIRKGKPKDAILTDDVLSFIRAKGYSEKFASIIELASNCNGPVFIFSNWLQFGVESLSIILDAIGFKKFPDSGIKGDSEYRYFVWSSETSGDKDLTSKAKSVFNSYENRDGSRLKIILGTRSIMEGVSFKNVKQVHITDPWWNEARIEQILARAVRFCSHTNLPEEEQWTDVYRHISVLPMQPDPDASEVLKEAKKDPNFKMLNFISIEQKMTISALKKYQINNEFEEILKETAYDCSLNKNGNIIRLEEVIVPIARENKFQIYFKNPKTLMNFKRESIPDEISYDDIISRKYSYPNTKDLPLKFTEVVINPQNGKLETLDDSKVIESPEITENLAMREDINCWNSDYTFEEILDSVDDDISKYIKKLTNNFALIPELRKKYLMEAKNNNKIKFNVNKQFKSKIELLKCLRDLSESPITDKALQNKIKKLLKTSTSEEKINEKISDLVYKYQLFPESMIPELMQLSSKELNDLLKEASK